jgi:hypothetical protein
MRTLAFHVTIVLMAAFAASCLAAQPVVVGDEVPAEGGFRSVTLLKGLAHPWSMAWLPNGDLLVTERPGRLRLVKGGRLVDAPVDGVPEVFAAGQGGLLDVGLHPRFSENRRVYFSYADGTTNANHTRVAAAILNGDRLEHWAVIFQVGVDKKVNNISDRACCGFLTKVCWSPSEMVGIHRFDLPVIGSASRPKTRATIWGKYCGSIIPALRRREILLPTGLVSRKQFGAMATGTSRGWPTIRFDKWSEHRSMGLWAEMS